MQKLSRFARFSWIVLFYNLLVILWGAYVRASGSGAGCGAHWPLCNGVIVPQAAQSATLIEFTHRLMSGVTLILSVVLAVWAWRSFRRGDSVRLGAGLALLFTLTEAMVGAGLVLLQLVDKNVSTTRAISIAVHLVNTLLLLGSLTLTAWWASGGERLRLRRRGALAWLLGGALLGLMVLSASGAITALGDTLFPSASLAEGLRQDVSPTSSFLIRLRVYHPLIASGLGIYLLVLVGWIRLQHPDPQARWLAAILTGLFLLQLALGVSNILLLAPVWLQLVHLLVADGVWIMLVLLTASCLKESSPALAFNRQTAREPS